MTPGKPAREAAPRFPFRRLVRIPIRIHSSWILLAGLVSASFAALYARGDPPVGTAAAVGLGALAAAGLVVSVLAHELAHGFAALRAGLRVSGITLKVLGGRTEIASEPTRPGVEFSIAAAGPLTTAALGLVFFLIGRPGALPLPPALASVATHVAAMNGLLLVLNLIPALPLDGGRLLRAVLWAVWGRADAAARAAAATGRSFGLLFIGLGVLSLFAGPAGMPRVLVGAAFVLVGFDLRRAAGEVTRHLWLEELLDGITVGHLLDYRVHSVQQGARALDLAAMEADAPVTEIPVLDEARLVGAVRFEDLRDRSRPNWEELTASHFMRTDILERTFRPGDAAIRVVGPLLSGRPTVAVLEEDRLIGVVTFEALSRRLSLRTES